MKPLSWTIEEPLPLNKGGTIGLAFAVCCQ